MTEPETTQEPKSPEAPAQAVDAIAPAGSAFVPPSPRAESVPPGIPGHRGVKGWLYDYFLGEDPTVGVAMVPLCFMSMLLYTRHPFKTNFIFDEQEALLANPYVRAAADPHTKIGWLDAFHRDFWGLTSERTIGSYRPIPDLIWRALWALHARETPFLHHWVNVLLHGLNGAIATVFVLRLTKDRAMAWLAGAFFVGAAVITEAVSGVVGLSDVLGGTGALLALLSLTLPMWAMPIACFASAVLGMYSKESSMCLVPLVPFAAVMLSQLTHPHRPMRWARAALSLVACAGAFVLYVETRRRWFQPHVPAELSVEANADKPFLPRTFAAILRWYAQPGLPRDPLNNPLIPAPTNLRIAGALRVYARGLGQVLFPIHLSGDYSSPQEPVPDKPIFVESVIGGLAMVLPLIVAPVLGVLAWLRQRKLDRLDAMIATPSVDTVLSSVRRLDLRPLVGVGMVWIVLSYFPVSNIPVVLPTVRAERFWYFPVIGSAIILAVVFKKLFKLARAYPAWNYAVAGLLVAFLGWQGIKARLHANDYTDDLVFWDATRHAVPRSAKAHLNYSVMLGARGDLQGRLDANMIAYDLAPDWPMASVYIGDTLCRMHRAPEALPHYLRGFDKGPNDLSLIALGMQCLWDEKMLAEGSDAIPKLQEVADKYPGSWLHYLVDDTISNGEENHGVAPKYRPRGYNEGPKGE